MREPLAQDPRRLGKYTLLERLGSGGMGAVYLARTPGGARVAVKTLHVHLARDQQFLIRFGREVAALRTVDALQRGYLEYQALADHQRT